MLKLLLQVEANGDVITIPATGDTRVFPVANLNDSEFPNDYLQDPGAGAGAIFKAPLPGKYRFSGILSADSADPGQVRLSIQRETGSARYGGIGHYSILPPTVLELAAGEVVSFRAYNPSTENPVTLQLGPEFNYGLIEYLGA